MTILYPREPRHAGATKYSLLGLVGAATDGIISFSLRPLRLATAFGCFASFLALLYGVFALVYWYVTRAPVAGWASLMIIVLFLGGVQLVTLGVVGEYIGRIYDEVRSRPLYTVASVRGFGAVVESRFRDTCLPAALDLPEYRGS